MNGRTTTWRVAGAVAVLGVAVLAFPAGAGAQELNLGGVMVWNCGYWDTVHVGDCYGPNYEVKKLKPISMIGARNGTFSGEVVVEWANGAIRNLRAKASDLVEKGGAKIPAAQVRVRYAERASDAKSWAPVYRFEGLLDEPPEEVPIIELKDVRGWNPKNDGPVATQPVWVTVRVPADAAPGDYEGKLTVESDEIALQPTEVPIRLRVHEWRLPDAKDFAVQNLAVVSPEAVARHYKMDLWTDRHWAMMAKSLELMREVGSRQVVVNLVADYPAQINAQSMVRWVKQADGTWKHDFTIFDRYMDVCAKAIGKPFPIRLNMWSAVKETRAAPKVTAVDPATGKLESLEQPAYGTAESGAFWKPVLDGVRERLEKRGWFDSVVVNWMNYCGGPEPATVGVLRKIWPDGKWSSMDHGRRTSFESDTAGERMPVIASTAVWQEGDLGIYERWKEGSPYPRGYKGRVAPGLAICGHARDRYKDWSPLWVFRALNEEMLMRGNHGLDPVGADLWPGEGIDAGRHPWTAYALGPGNATKAMLAPGKDGAVATERFEALREGVQIAETMVFLEKALEAGKVTGELAVKVNRVLDERGKHFMSSYKPGKDGRAHLDFAALAAGAQERDSELFATAGEVQKAAGGVK